MAMIPMHDRRGVSLITTLLLVFLMMVAVIGAFTRTMGERRNAIDQTAQVDAFALAQEGLERYVATRTTMPATLPDSLEVTLTGGRAVVTLRRARASTSDTTLVLVSRGENTTTNRYAANTTPAVRTVAQLVRFSSGSFPAPAALTVLGGIQQNGSSATFSGVDQCSGKPSIPGLAVPTDSFLTGGGGGGGGGKKSGSGGSGGTYSGIDGNPDNVPYEMGTVSQAAASVPVDWAGIVDGSAVPPGAIELTAKANNKPDGWLSSWFPSSPKANPWPLVIIRGADQALSNQTDGYGILVITGNATINGSWNWDGIVLIGGALTGNGNNNVNGTLLAGLNTKLGQTVAQTNVSNGTKLVQFNSCHIASAMNRFGGWQRMSNAWVDNWPSY